MMRYLRYAAAVVFALLAVGFVALWVRSNSLFDELWIPVPFGRKLGLLSLDNFASITWENNPDGNFIFRSSNVDVYLRPKTHWGFLFVSEPDSTYVCMPHWFLAASSLALAALFAFKRTWRYSLRTILVATTLLAGLLGLAVYVAGRHVE
jgi:hypothetical protein